jgi:hypothetical protein
MSAANYREKSRQDWHRTIGGEGATDAEIQLGALQRIADAAEKMAASYDTMRNSRDYWQRRAEDQSAEIGRMVGSIRALRGVITRMKRKGSP